MGANAHHVGGRATSVTLPTTTSPTCPLIGPFAMSARTSAITSVDQRAELSCTCSSTERPTRAYSRAGNQTVGQPGHPKQ
eukprot:3796853-Rhodomonas_salina.4